MIIPNIWENKKWQPNHQPVKHLFGPFGWPRVIWWHMAFPFLELFRKVPRSSTCAEPSETYRSFHWAPSSHIGLKMRHVSNHIKPPWKKNRAHWHITVFERGRHGTWCNIMGYHVTSWDIMGYHGISWDIMGYHGISWDIMGYHGISWDIMGYHGISWDIMGYHGISWDIMGYHGISWDIMG